MRGRREGELLPGLRVGGMVGWAESGALRGGSALIESGFGLMTCRTGRRGVLLSVMGLSFAWLVSECAAATVVLLVVVVVDVHSCCVNIVVDLRDLLLLLRVPDGIG